jgi:hypothetical protein
MIKNITQRTALFNMTSRIVKKVKRFGLGLHGVIHNPFSFYAG